MSHALDEEVLESLSYERSKIWSNFLTSCASKNDDIEIETDQIEELFKDEECGDDDDEDEREEAEESNVEDDINNTTQCMSKAELTLILCQGDNKEILDHTMPIVEEHVRKWKEAGLDRILNTFDAQKIEQHVGDWLRRHNSAYGDKTMLQMSSPASVRRHKRYKTVNQIYTPSCSSEEEEELSDAGSMHSAETARYIRDSRKRTVSTASASASLKCRSPMTKIKMYRTLPRKRAELRAKYACHDYNEEQEHRHHMQSLIQRRKQFHRRQRERELIYHTSPRQWASCYSGQQLRKRRDISRGYQTTSSSEDEHKLSRCACSTCTNNAFSKTAYPYYTTYHNSYQSRSHSHSYRDYQRLEVGSRSIASHVHFKRSVRQLRRQHALDEDLRPRLIENECSCCNNDRLCTKVVHLANSSTDEWVVENKSSPDPTQFETPKSCKDLQPKNQPKTIIKKLQEKTLKKTVAKETNEDLLEQPRTITKAKTKAKSTVTFSNVDLTPSKTVPPSAKKSTATATVSKSTSLPKAKKEKLQFTVSSPFTAKTKKEKPAIKTESETKAKNTKLLTKMNGTKSKKSKDNMKVTSQRNINKKKPQDVESTESDDDLRQALALSEATYVIELEKLKLAKDEPSASGSPQLPEQSIFNNHSVACNSTALTNDTACSRALHTHHQEMKPLQHVADEVINLCSSTSFNSNAQGDADCTLVTSTTGCESVPGALSVPEKPATSERSSLKISKKGVLLYEPPQPNISSSNGSGNFTLTEQILSPIIGQRRARKFLKYYTGSCSFDSRYYVYYRPPGKLLAALSSDTKSLDLNSSSSSGSEDDIFEIVERYGVIQTMLEKCSEN